MSGWEEDIVTVHAAGVCCVNSEKDQAEYVLYIIKCSSSIRR